MELGFREDLDLEDDEEIICPICRSDRLNVSIYNGKLFIADSCAISDSN